MLHLNVKGDVNKGVGISITLVKIIVILSFFFQAEDGIRDAQESRGLGDVYKRQLLRKGGEFMTC